MNTTIAVGTILLTLSASGFAFDKEKAAHYLKIYEKAEGAAVGKALHLMTPDVFLAKLKAGEKFVLLDVRTEKETEILGVRLPGTIRAPLNRVFEEENLAKLPKDKTILVVCRSGVRSTLVTTGLRDIGFANAYSLKGGILKLADSLSPKIAE
jgi:rhodanese-related sulfurtransferase